MFLAARLPATMKRFGRDLYVERSRKVRAAHGLLQRREGFVTVVWNAGVVQWQYRSFPSFGRGFDSHRPLHNSRSFNWPYTANLPVFSSKWAVLDPCWSLRGANWTLMFCRKNGPVGRTKNPDRPFFRAIDNGMPSRELL